MKPKTSLRALLAGVSAIALFAAADAGAVPTSALLQGSIAFNEILIDPNGSLNFDTDGNGDASQFDEFLELVNIGSSSVDISGWQLWDQGTDNWFTFPSNTTLGAGNYASVITQVQSGGSFPATDPGNLWFDAARTSSAVFNNGGDNVVLLDPGANEFIQFLYNGDPEDNPPDPGSGYDAFPSTATRIGPVENWGNDQDGVSLARTPDGDEQVAQHLSVSSEQASPGAANPSPSVVVPADRTIPQIQGPDHTSPEVGNLIRTTGIVTALADNGFYLQDPAGDGDDNTSDGIFVFTGGAPSVTLGNEVQLTGQVNEFFNETQITLDTVESETTTTVTIAPLTISTDSSADRQQPNTIIDDNGGDNFNPATDGRDFYESLEGMLVTLPNAQAVSDEDTRSNRGEYYAVSTDNDDGNLTTLNSRGGITISEDTVNDFETNPQQADLNPERILIVGTPQGDIRPDTPPEMGDLVGSADADGDGQADDITGPVQFSFNDYRIRPLQQVTTTEVDRPDEVTALTSDGDRLTVATFNVLNLDPSDADLLPDGRDPTRPRDRFEQLAQQIVNNMGSPDLIALQEIQDNNGSASGGVSADETLQTLIDAIEAAGGPTYEFKDNIFITEDASGGQPGGNIRTAYLFNAARIDVDDASLSSLDRFGDRVFDPLDIGDTQTNPASPFFDTRLPLILEFEFNGENVLVINNHFPSKSGSDPLFGSTQPAANGGVEDRNAIAALINDFVDLLLATDPDANLIVLGDLNEFQFYDPLKILTGEDDGSNVLFNLAFDPSLDPEDVFTFEFEGNSQALDHITISDALRDLLFGVDYVHLNSGKLFETLISDHDPIVAAFLFADAIPVPGSIAVLIVGLLGFGVAARRRVA